MNNAGGSAATRAKNKYNEKAYDRFFVTLPKGEKMNIDTYVKEKGYKSRNEFVVAAIREKMEKGE